MQKWNEKSGKFWFKNYDRKMCFFVRDFVVKSVSYIGKKLFKKIEGKLIEKIEIKNRFRFEKVDRKLNRSLENFYSKK